MVDVGDKAVTSRRAETQGELRCAAETLAAVRAGTTPKGSVIATAELAGVMAAKRTADLTLFDMLKAVDKGMAIGAIRVTAKSGGRSGEWTAA